MGVPEIRDINGGLSHPKPESEWERISAYTRWGRYQNALKRRALGDALTHIGGTALDIGSGGGLWAWELSAYGFNVVCADVNTPALERCRRRVPAASIVLVDSSARTLPMPDDSARLVLAYEVPPVTQAPWFAAEVRRVLQAGGKLVCTFHNPLSWRGATGLVHTSLSARSRARDPDSYHGPTYLRFRRSLQAAGLQIVHEEGMGWPPFTSSSDSRLVTVFTAIERALGLRRLVALSPKVIVVATLAPDGSPRRDSS